MSYDSEKALFDHLGINNADQNRGEKLIEFASLLNEVDPAVAREIIERIPEFAGQAMDAFEGLAKTFNQSNEDSVAECHNACRMIIDTLGRQMDNPDLPFEEKRFYLEKMMETADKMAKKDTENKDHLGKMIGTCAAAFIGGAAAVLAVLGVKNIRTKS